MIKTSFISCLVAHALAAIAHHSVSTDNDNAAYETCSNSIDLLKLGVQNVIIMPTNYSNPEYEKLDMITRTPRMSRVSELFDMVSYWKPLSEFDNATLFG